MELREREYYASRLESEQHYQNGKKTIDTFTICLFSESDCTLTIPHDTLCSVGQWAQKRILDTDCVDTCYINVHCAFRFRAKHRRA